MAQRITVIFSSKVRSARMKIIFGHVDQLVLLFDGGMPSSLGFILVKRGV